MRRVIREEEPPRPSTAIEHARDAAQRGGLPQDRAARSWRRLLKGELDWVVMKALEKDRTRRYETANGLARDLQRYLADELVEARPASCGTVEQIRA